MGALVQDHLWHAKREEGENEEVKVLEEGNHEQLRKGHVDTLSQVLWQIRPKAFSTKARVSGRRHTRDEVL